MSTSYRDYNFQIPASGEYDNLAVPKGTYWQCIATQSGGAVKLVFDNGAALLAPVGTGGPQAYTRVNVLGTAGDTVTLRLGDVGGMPPYDSRGTLSGVTVQSIVTVGATHNPLGDQAVGAGASSALAGANINRRAIIIKNPSASAGPVRIGAPGTVDNAHGVMLEPGEALTLECTAGVSAWNPNASAVTLTMTEIAL
jgi:hypothetical protein